jgi:hypothetical protein
VRGKTRANTGDLELPGLQGHTNPAYTHQEVESPLQRATSSRRVNDKSERSERKSMVDEEFLKKCYRDMYWEGLKKMVDVRFWVL